MPIHELKVDITPEIRKLDVYAKQNILTRTLEGNWTALFKGRGMEFAGYRTYTFGDDASIIDWKATLRSKEILVKEYEEEKLLNVFFLVDVSNSMLFGSGNKLKCEYAAELVASLSFAILRAGDAVGLSMFSDRIISKKMPSMGKAAHYLLLQDLLNVNNYGGNFKFDECLKFTMSLLKSNALIIIVSDFIGLKPGWYKYLSIASQRFEIIGIMIRDPRDRELPRGVGQYVLEDPYSNEKLYVDVNKYAEKYKKYVIEEEENIMKYFKTTKSDIILLTTDQDYYEPILKFFKRRAFKKI